jgi:predicted dehydrogenase/nucleoside-diphosphate-sugar epimerase
MSTHRLSLRIALVGAGAMARAHLDAIRRCGVRAEVAGVTDVNPVAAESLAAAAGCRAFPSIEALLEATPPDVAHICTPPATHYAFARQCLEAGSHVYIEKPIAPGALELDALLQVATEHKRLVCGGHQMLADPAYSKLLARLKRISPLLRAEARFYFQSPTVRPHAPLESWAAQLLDILPHPIAILVDALNHAGHDGHAELEHAEVSATAIDATIRAGELRGRLVVSLRDRPVTASLTWTGERGTLQAEFVRGVVLGVPNPGTTPFEKILNPMFEGTTQVLRSAAALVKRVSQPAYPGLSQHIGKFYDAIQRGSQAPTTIGHLRVVTSLYEQLAKRVNAAVENARPLAGVEAPARTPLVVLTGAGGFLGRAVARELVLRGYRVRGLGRGPDPRDRNVAEWVRVDLSRQIPADVMSGAYAVVHAAAATSGGFDDHQRHSVAVAEHVAAAVESAGVKRFVHVSSLSVLEPPRGMMEVQSERTPLASAPRVLGAYTWGKHESEVRITDLAHQGGVSLRIIRPAALIDWTAPELPGLMGRRLFGDWHVGFGRPGLPMAAVGVDRAATAIAWCVSHFDDAPPIINLTDPDLATRRDITTQLRLHGWTGRMVWVPISFIAAGIAAAKTAIAVLRRKRGERLSAWQVLRPRRFDTHISVFAFDSAAAASRAATVPEVSPPERVPASV